MKNIVLIKFIIILLLSINPGYASKLPNIPKGIDNNTYCDKKGGSFGHVIVVIDLTTKLDEARIEFIKDQVFSKEFYLNYDPFTKFSYFLINHNEPTKQKFLFSKCRPKTGDANLSKTEKKELLFFDLRVVVFHLGRWTLKAQVPSSRIKKELQQDSK